MGRIRRIAVPGLPHHVTQRGNLDGAVFADESDRLVYLSMLGKAATRRGLGIWAYCLMTNHVHLIALPKSEDSLTLTMHDAQSAYSNWFNKKTDRPGNLWRTRFYSCVMDEPHLWAAVRYVERNPVAAGLVQHAEEYRWSSAPARCGLRQDALLSSGFPFPGVVADWREWLADEDVEATKEIRVSTRLGLPCGAGDFTSGLESKVGRLLRHRDRGRPKGS